MRPLIALLLIGLSFSSFAKTSPLVEEFAIIQDKDGFCNVRSTAETGNNITCKLNNGHIVYVYEKKGNWMSVSFSKNSKDADGFIYHDRLKLVSSYKNIPLSVYDEHDKWITLSKDSIKVRVSIKAFDKSQYRFTYYENDKNGPITLINGKQYYGSDGEMPETAYGSISIGIGKKKITLPRAALENLFEPSIYSTEVHYDTANDILYITASNSDGAGAYNIIWKIEKGVYKGRFVIDPC